MEELHNPIESYSQNEWKGAILSLGRLVDIRNFPDVAADVLMGRQEAFLGRGLKVKTKAIDPNIIGAIVIWTKGPAELLVEHPGLREALETYNNKKTVIGLQLSVTGLGGTFLEPGIKAPEDTANGLMKVLKTGLIDPRAITVRYDPMLKIKAPDGRIIRNDTKKSFERVVALFAPLGISTFETKFLLLGSQEDQKYNHVWKRMQDAGIIPLPYEEGERERIFQQLTEVAITYRVNIFSCCVKVEQGLSGWTHDQGCLSAKRLTEAGKLSSGEHWNRISFKRRPSRPGCLCTHYIDLSNVRGHKKCGSQDAACLYCTASAKVFGKVVNDKIKSELDAFASGERADYYKHLITDE